jgi:hypothetical protein
MNNIPKGCAKEDRENLGIYRDRLIRELPGKMGSNSPF